MNLKKKALGNYTNKPRSSNTR